METVVNKKGQTKIPATLRKRYEIHAGDRLMWLDEGDVIRVILLPADPITTLRGSARGERLLERLLQQRDEDETSSAQQRRNLA